MRRYHWFIALRHLATRRRQTFLSVLGVAIGAMILITTLSMTEGLIADIESTIIEASPHLVVKAEPLVPRRERLVEGELVALMRQGRRAVVDKLKEGARMEARVAASRGVTAVSPFVEVRGILRHGARFKAVTAIGMHPERESRVSVLSRKMIAGRWDDLERAPDGVLLGRILAKNLGAKVGNRLRLVDPDGRLWTVRVIGIFKAGLKNIDESTAYMNMHQAQVMRRFDASTYSGFNVRTEDPRRVDQVAGPLASGLGQKVETWAEKNRTILASFRQNNQITLLLVLFTFVVSGFGVANVLNTVVLEKTRDIAVLKSLGVDRQGIGVIFTLEGVLIGLMGAAIGGGLGWGLSTAIGLAPMDYGEAAVIQTGHIAMAQAPWYYVVTMGFSVLVAAMASRGPTRRAARLTPIEIFRGY